MTPTQASPRVQQAGMSRSLQRWSAIVICLMALVVSISCSDVTAPATRPIPVPTPAMDMQSLPPAHAILGVSASTATPPVFIANYPWVEQVLVEGWINGLISVNSNVDASAVTVKNGLVDYKGVWDFSTNQCDWSAWIGSATLRYPGSGCLTAQPRYTSIWDWRDTILVGGYPSTGNADVYAKRGGTSGDPPNCGPGVPLPCNCPDGSPCHSVSGGQTVTLTPLPATIRLTTTNVSEIAPKTILIPDPGNGSTIFKVSSTPASYHGITVPTQAISWQWIPAQGDSAVTAKCPTPLTDHISNTCSVVLFERGTMVVTARVNGVVQVDSMKVTGPQVTLTVTKSSMLPSVKPYTGLDSRAVHDEKQTVTVSVIDTLGHPIPFKSVSLRAFAAEGTAGHAHNNPSFPKPPGEIIGVVNTGSTGIKSDIQYTAPEPSGPVLLKASMSGAGSVQKKIMIEVPNLHSYGPQIGADTTGGRPEHPAPGNHWATDLHIGRLALFASIYNRQFPGKPLTFNDSSLPNGGLFDIAANWHPDHAGHRWGNNTDVKTHIGHDPMLNEIQVNAIQGIWLHLAARNFQGHYADMKIHPDCSTCKPHIHLIY